MRRPWFLLLAACADSSEPAPIEPCADKGLAPCDGQCSDLASDDANCGACGHACHAQLTCKEGECVPRCPGAFLYCDGACVDIQRDPANCGACGSACPEGEACDGGSCRCGGDLARCGDSCADLNVSLEHCGDCDVACTGEFDVCNAGMCQQDCAAYALSDCFGSCKDILGDESNCGECAFSCGSGYDCTAAMCGCTVGACGLCGIQDLGNTVPVAVSGKTLNNQNHVDPPCALTGAPEASYLFTAPETKTYVYRLVTATYWSAIYAVLPSCGPGACDYNLGGDVTIAKPMTAGEQIYLVVDGHGMTDDGSYSLVIDEGPPCPDEDLGSTAPLTLNSSTAGLLNVYGASCANALGPEKTYRFTAPATGSYTIDTFGTTFDTTLTIHDTVCGGAELACNGDAGSTQSQVTVPLTAGQVIIINVDGVAKVSNGSFQLHISAPF